jgi:hypothetical protein
MKSVIKASGGFQNPDRENFLAHPPTIFSICCVLFLLFSSGNFTPPAAIPNPGEKISSLSAHSQTVKFAGFSLTNFNFTLLGKPGVPKNAAEPLFGEDPSASSILWSVLWQIPWKAQFGRFFEWTPFLFSLAWLIVWHFVMLLIHYARSLKQQVANSMFYELTKFLQIIYGFCCTQALL